MDHVQHLIDELVGSDFAKKVDAVKELGSCNDPRAVNALIDAVSDVNFPLRQHAAASLGKLKPPHAVDALLQAASDPAAYWQVHELAAWALGEIGDPRAGDQLLSLEASGNADIAQSARFALVTLNEKRIIPRLISGLSSSDEWGRYESALLLGRIGDETAILALERFLSETVASVRTDIDAKRTAKESLRQIQARLKTNA
jgi:HEAT repeat protein